MMTMNHEIVFKTDGKSYLLHLLHSVEIQSSVEVLADVAKIVLPEFVLNQALNFGDKVKRGSEVTIKLGYNDNLVQRFKGYVKDVDQQDSSLVIDCEDGLFLFRTSVQNKQFKNTNVEEILKYLLNEIKASFKIVCDHNISYEKFDIVNATAFDVLKKLQEECRSNVYFKMDKQELHFSSPFLEKSGEVKLSPQKNIESVGLNHKKSIDRKFEVVLENVDVNGKITTVKRGTSGGDTITLRTSAIKESELVKIADAELKKRSGDMYEGSVDCWLVPVVEPTMTVIYTDEDYPVKDGNYYVKAVKTSFSEAGGKQTVEFGIRVG